jgi:outer membrane immunogenic protein
MKKISLIAASVAAMVASPALSEDADWTGPYVGAHIGYGTGSSDTDVALSGAWTSESQSLQDYVTSTFGDSRKPEGLNFGGQLGYNYQTAGNFVLGAEADFTILNADNSRSTGLVPTTPFPALSYNFGNGVDAKHMFSLRARAGVALDKTLIYASGGWQWTKAEFFATMSSNGGYNKAGSTERTLDGFIIGGGVEHKFSDTVSARLDYAYADQGRTSYVTSYLPGSSFVTPAYTEGLRQDLDMHLIRVGLNFHF